MSSLAEEHGMLREALGSLLDTSMASSVIERCYEEPQLPREPWTAAAEGGWLALLDDAGLGLLDVAVLAEEIGSHLLSGPFSTTVGLCVPLLRALGADEQVESVIDGSSLMAAALPAPVWNEHGLVWDPVLSCKLEGLADGVVTGTARNVPYLADADQILLIVSCSDGFTRALVVPQSRSGITITRGQLVDGTRPMADLELDGLVVSGDDWLDAFDKPVDALMTTLMPRYLSILNGEMVGAMRELLSRTVVYVGERTQFGVPIGSFQAIKHLLADAEVQHQVARVFGQRTAIALDSDEAESVDHLAARLFTLEAYAHVAETAMQCFGGYGYTWEYELHLWYRRALIEQAQPVPIRELRRLVGLAVAAGHEI